RARPKNSSTSASSAACSIRRTLSRATSSRIDASSRSDANSSSICARRRSVGDTRRATGVGPPSLLLQVSKEPTPVAHLHQGPDATALRDYLALGEAEGVPSGYKCSIRKDWWSVPSVWRPDAFMLRQLHTHPRLVLNLTGATSTDTVHRVRFNEGVDGSRLAAGMINSATFAMAEVVGRSYGGGILELEPREAEDLLVPPPDAVPPELASTVDEHLRSGSLMDAVDLVDRVVLVESLGLSTAEVRRLRSAWATLRERRGTRGRSNRATPLFATAGAERH